MSNGEYGRAALDEVRRRLTDTSWSSDPEDRIRIALLHIDAARRAMPLVTDDALTRAAVVKALRNEARRLKSPLCDAGSMVAERADAIENGADW